MATIKAPLDAMEAEAVARRFAALAVPTRLLILDYLRSCGEAPVGEIAVGVGRSQQNTSKHLGVLRDVDMVARRKRGTTALYRVATPSVNRLCDEARGWESDASRPRPGRQGPPRQRP